MEYTTITAVRVVMDREILKGLIRDKILESLAEEGKIPTEMPTDLNLDFKDENGCVTATSYIDVTYEVQDCKF